jgi:PleD family two-component response regulator
LIQIPIRISMGVAALISGGALDKLIRAADAALYRAKHGGGDRTAS